MQQPLGTDMTPDYADRFLVDCPHATARSAEDWLRAAWEGAPRALRWLLVLGWRLVLWLPLGPSGVPGHVLGWPVTATRPGEALATQHSWLVDARITLIAGDDRLDWRSAVTYEHPAARFVWALVRPFHRLIVPFALRLAVRRGGVTSTGG